MDEMEKTREFEKRFGDVMVFDGEEIRKEDTSKYSILKFIGVDDSYRDPRNGIGNLWDFNYKERPGKYIVFHTVKDENPIEGEGLTGMAARRKKVLYFKDSEIELAKARTHKGSDTERKIHPVCRQVVCLPIVEEEVSKGVVRLDIYELPNRRGQDFANLRLFLNDKDPEVPTDSPAFLVVNELCKQIVAIGNRNAGEQSYSNLFYGERMIDAIKLIKSVAAHGKGFDSDVYNLVQHLFFVLQRQTYIGYDELMQRVLYFIKDLFDLLGLEDYFALFEGKLKEFRDHERFMLYDIAKYRDHFMHQFHVFVLGYVVLSFIGPSSITSSINKRLQNTSEYNKVEIDNAAVLRIWALISFFHDITYLFEDYESKMEDFVFNQLGVSLPIHIDWGSLLSSSGEGGTYMDWLRNMIAFFESPETKNSTSKECLLANCIQALHDSQDHGTLGALLLIKMLMPRIHESIRSGALRDHDANTRIVEVYLAALSICMHNSCIFDSLKEDLQNNKITFESFPLEFLLMFCDTAQEWGRNKEIDQNPYDAPVLKSLELTTTNRDRKAIVCNLHYRTGLVPPDSKLREFLQKKRAKFCSTEHEFQITYSYETGKKPVPFTFFDDHLAE
jgi:hypothetical protein